MKSNLAEVALISSSSIFFCPSSSDWTLKKHLSVRGITLCSPESLQAKHQGFQLCAANYSLF